MKYKLILATVLAAVLAGCASPPPPPSCKGDNKRPINRQQAEPDHAAPDKVSSLHELYKASFNACS